MTIFKGISGGLVGNKGIYGDLYRDNGKGKRNYYLGFRASREERNILYRDYIIGISFRYFILTPVGGKGLENRSGIWLWSLAFKVQGCGYYRKP